jgi:4-hydroxybenzoate polyprenyltransferase
MLRTLLDLGRISNLPTVWTNLTAAWLLGGGSLKDLHLAGIAAGASLLYLAGMTLNDAAGAEFDREHKPQRPIPRGCIKEQTVWILGGSYLAAGALSLLLVSVPAVLIAGIVLLITAYTLTHKHWRHCTLFMGGIRSCLYLIGGFTAVRLTPLSASSDLFPAVAIPLWAMAIGIYTVLLTATARHEYPASARASALPLTIYLIPIAASLATCMLILPRDFITIMILVVTHAAFIFWLRQAGRALIAGRTGPAIGRLLAGFVLIDALAVCAAHPYTALVLLPLAPALLLWQRLIPAT